MKTAMQVIPAIDLRGAAIASGSARAITDSETVFGDDPAAMAAKWESEGATARIHLVDLDGAKEGRPVNTEAVRAILEGGQGPLSSSAAGIRDESTIADLAGWPGSTRVIVGTQGAPATLPGSASMVTEVSAAA